MTCRLTLAWAAGATTGLVVGFLAGGAFQDAVDLAYQRRAAEKFLRNEGADPTPEQRARARQVQPHTPSVRLTILANKNVSRGKYASAAVHAALSHYGITHGAVIVLGASPAEIEAGCTSVIHDAGHTEVAPLTVTAGILEDQ